MDNRFQYLRGTTTETAATITTDKKGQVIFRGLDGDKSYQLVELTTLDGYNLMSEPAPLTLTKEDPAATAASIDAGEAENTTYLAAASVTKVPNNAGTVLPSTGGMSHRVSPGDPAPLWPAAGTLWRHHAAAGENISPENGFAYATRPVR